MISQMLNCLVGRVKTMKNRSRDNKRNAVEDYLKTTLSSSGLKRGTDYTLSEGQVFFKVIPESVKKNKLTQALSQLFPQFYFSWDSARMLTWF